MMLCDILFQFASLKTGKQMAAKQHGYPECEINLGSLLLPLYFL